jgi:cytosolic carboxypeptidase protein 2/3
VYFAHSYPYTFSDLQRYLNRLESDPRKKLRFRRKVLCQTLAGNNVDMLIVTSFAPLGGEAAEQIKQRKGVVISSRVHPGETGASFMVKGIIDYLVGPSLGARILRDNFVFKIVPMLNPDGVINGNTRCNLAGVDLNR